MKKLLFFIAAIALLSSCSNEPQLALNLELNKDYKQSTDLEATIIQEFGGEQIEISMTIQGGMNYHVTEVSDDYFDLEVTYDSLKMGMELPLGSMNFNSQNPGEDDLFSQILAGMENKAFNIKMARNGKVLEVNNIDVLFDSVFAQFPELQPMQVEQLKSQLMESYGPDAFKGNMEMASAIFPENNVVIGDSWDVETELKSATMKADIATTYTLKEIQEDYFILDGESKITTEEGGEVNVEGTTMTFDLEGKMISEIKVDINSGWIINADVTQEIKGTSEMAPSLDIPNGMSMPINMKNKLTLKGS